MSIASELQDKINSKAAIKAAIEAKGVTVGDVKLNQYAAKIDAIAQDPSNPVGAGQHLVTFYDFDGKVLKRQRVNTGEDATAPEIPTHEFLTFAEWNNPFTNIQSDIDTGAIYNTTDGKTYIFITLTPVTGLAPTLYFSKSSTSLMTIDWGDGTSSISTTSGNQNINHVYASAGDYIITVDNSAGGTWAIGQSTSYPAFLDYRMILRKTYIGSFVNNIQFFNHQSLRYVSLDTVINFQNIYSCLRQCGSLSHINIPKSSTGIASDNFRLNYTFTKIVIPDTVITTGNEVFQNCYGLKKIIIPRAFTSFVGTNTFQACYSLVEIIILADVPPTLANISTFSGINPVCKIYVPDASVEAYKSATNWVTYANYIYPLSQKPQSDE